MNDGKQFEFQVQELLRLMGLNASVTGYSQDGGVDLIAENPDPVFGGKGCVAFQV
jgi:HJR/Mrr/RecB family endonuclease